MKYWRENSNNLGQSAKIKINVLLISTPCISGLPVESILGIKVNEKGVKKAYRTAWGGIFFELLVGDFLCLLVLALVCEAEAFFLVPATISAVVVSDFVSVLSEFRRCSAR